MEMERTCNLSKAAKKDIQYAREKEGSQFIEYGLIIAAVSSALVIALQIASENAGFGYLIARLTSCLARATCA